MSKRVGIYGWVEYAVDKETALNIAFSQGYWAAAYRSEKDGGQYNSEKQPEQRRSWLAGHDSFDNTIG
jgi:hypothetical protein